MSIPRRLTLVGIVVAASAALGACTPAQVAWFTTSATPEQQAHVVKALQAPPAHTPPGGFLACVRAHESGGNYRAANPVSTASGAYQFLDSTWRTLSGRSGHSGYARAMHAPPAVQDAVAQWTIAQPVRVSGGYGNWAGTGCGHGT